MLPALKARSDAATAARCIPAETIREMQDAGFFRVLQPARHGGYEMHPQVFYEIQMALGEGLHVDGLDLRGASASIRFSSRCSTPRAQSDVWSKSDETLVSSSYQPVGKVERVDGGYRLSGRWGFLRAVAITASGCCLGSADPAGRSRRAARDAHIPAAAQRLTRSCTTGTCSGCRRPGSHGIVVDKASCPSTAPTARSTASFGKNPGHAVNTSALFRLPWAQVFVRAVSTAAIGALQGALDSYVSIASKRVSDEHRQGDSASILPC